MSKILEIEIVLSHYFGFLQAELYKIVLTHQLAKLPAPSPGTAPAHRPTTCSSERTCSYRLRRELEDHRVVWRDCGVDGASVCARQVCKSPQVTSGDLR